MTRRGFSLLEALVALAIASVCLLALFGLQQRLVDGQRRAEAAVARAESRRNVLALVRDLNPELQPEGAVALPDGERLTWTSRPLGPPRRALQASGAPGPFAVRLHEVHAALTAGAGARLVELSVERMGWRRVAAPGRAAAPSSAAATPPPLSPP